MTIAEQVTRLKTDLDEVKSAGIAEGRQAEHNAFWGAFQRDGNREDYTYGFAGHGWNRDNFFPVHNMTPTTLNTCFHSFNRNDPNWQTFDMVERLSECGVTLNTSASTNNTNLFMWARVGRVGVIDCTGTTTHTLNASFGYGLIETIDELIVKPENVFTNTFINNTALTNITFGGTIGNDISFQWQKNLSKKSIQSIIEHLSASTSGKTLTLSKAAVTSAFGSTSADEWTALIAPKIAPNGGWTIILV